LHGGIFNFREDAKDCKELVLTGKMKGLLPRLLSYYDMSIEDYSSSEDYIEALGIKINEDIIEAKAQKLAKQEV